MSNKYPRGYSSLTFVLIISGIILAMSLFLNVRIRAESQNTLLYRSSEMAAASSLSCTEEAHLRLQRERSYSGGQLNITNALCTITITTTPGGFEILSNATHGSATRTYRLEVEDQSGILQPVSLTEVP